MKKVRRKFTASFKAQVAIEGLKERQMLAAFAERFEFHSNQPSQWKLEFLENSPVVFSGTERKEKEAEINLEAVYARIGQLEVERDFLEKSLKKSGR